MEERLQKLISSCGLASRRTAEAWISQGRVTVNGCTARVGDKADPGGGGRRSPPAPDGAYISYAEQAQRVCDHSV